VFVLTYYQRKAISSTRLLPRRAESVQRSLRYETSSATKRMLLKRLSIRGTVKNGHEEQKNRCLNDSVG
jgi:hypothetical protein